MADLAIIPSGAALAAQVKGIDLGRSHSREVMDTVRAAFTAHSVLLLRDQHLSQADQIRFSRWFGQPVPHPTNMRDRDPDFPEITLLSNIEHNHAPLGALGNDEVDFDAQARRLMWRTQMLGPPTC